MTYSQYALAAIGAAVLANLLDARTGLPIAFFVNMGVLIVLSRTAIQFHRAQKPGFDPIVAAETIVAFGVTSLILSLVTALLPVAFGGGLEGLVAGKSLVTFARPFLEGLATAGLAPLAAMVLRNRVSELDATADTTADTASLSRAMSSLAADVDSARVGIAQLGGAIDQLGQAMTTAVGSTRALAVDVNAESARLKDALAAAKDQIGDFASKAGAAGATIGSAGEEVARLKTAMQETGTLLLALSKLIEAVERFVAPGTRRDA